MSTSESVSERENVCVCVSVCLCLSLCVCEAGRGFHPITFVTPPHVNMPVTRPTDEKPGPHEPKA